MLGTSDRDGVAGCGPLPHFPTKRVAMNYDAARALTSRQPRYGVTSAVQVLPPSSDFWTLPSSVAA